MQMLRKVSKGKYSKSTNCCCLTVPCSSDNQRVHSKIFNYLTDIVTETELFVSTSTLLMGDFYI